MTRDPRPMIMVTAKLAERFNRFVSRSEGGCWEWVGNRSRQGYGKFGIGRTNYQAHRVAYEMATGVYPGRRLVCHTCDNPPCVNPAHLWLGDTSANARDMIVKGRGPNKTPDHCVRCGHRRTDDYISTRPGGRTVRQCRKCALERRRNASAAPALADRLEALLVDAPVVERVS